MATTATNKGGQTRARIVRAAEREFATFGYEATRLELIGEAVGIRRAAIFYHFASKAELFDAIFGEIHESLVAATQARLDGASDPWERLMLLVECWVDFMVARPTAARLILRNCANVTYPDGFSSAGSHDALQLLRDVIGEGIAAERFDARLSMHLVNLLGGSILHYVCDAEHQSAGSSYNPADPTQVAYFKTVLRKAARAIVG